MTLPELEATLAMLKRQGVKSFTDVAGGGFTVEYFPAMPDAGPVEKVKDTSCKCGHAMHEHGDGMCLLGCDPVKCAPEDK